MYLLEIGYRSAVAAGQLLSQLNAEQIEYMALDHAKEWVLQKQQRLSHPGLVPVCCCG